MKRLVALLLVLLLGLAATPTTLLVAEQDQPVQLLADGGNGNNDPDGG